MWLCFQAAESNRLCRRLQLKDIIPVEMQRATKYPILLDKIAKYTGRRVRLISTLGGFDGAWAKLEGGRGNFYLTLRFFCCFFFLSAEDEEEAEKVKKAGECCRQILSHVNQAVKEAENKQVSKPKPRSDASQMASLSLSGNFSPHHQKRLEDYQRRLDISSLKPNENPLVAELRVGNAKKGAGGGGAAEFALVSKGPSVRLRIWT